MKKIISTLLVSLLAASSAFAASAKHSKPAPSAPAANMKREMSASGTNRGGFSRAYGLAGCGLGSMAFGPHGGQIWAATTNGIAGQTFAITSGTSNCVESPTSAKADRMDKYIVANKIALADDIARGQGETIQGLAQIMNCQQADGLGTMLQSKFSTIFPSHDLEANEITDRIITVVGQDGALASACGVTLSASL